MRLRHISKRIGTGRHRSFVFLFVVQATGTVVYGVAGCRECVPPSKKRRLIRAPIKTLGKCHSISNKSLYSLSTRHSIW
jgi:hypothetical protein